MVYLKLIQTICECLYNFNDMFGDIMDFLFVNNLIIRSAYGLLHGKTIANSFDIIITMNLFIFFFPFLYVDSFSDIIRAE